MALIKYNGILGKFGGSLGGFGGAAPAPPSATLISEWPFLSDGTDSVSSYDLTLSGDPELPDFVEYPASSGEYGMFIIGELGQEATITAVECPNIFTPIRADDPWSLSFWYCNPTPEPEDLSGAMAIGVVDVVDIYSNGGEVFVSLSGGTEFLIGLTIDPETWYLITLAFDGTEMKTYYDASLVDERGFSYSGYTEDVQPIMFGQGALIPAVEAVFSDARFYTGTLSGDDITALYAAGPTTA